MIKKLTIIILCLATGIFFTTLSFSQADKKADEPQKAEIKEEAVKTEADKKEEKKVVVLPAAKTFTDGAAIYVNSQVLFKLTATDDISLDKIEYKIDDAAPLVYQNPFSLATEGPHSIKYYGIDRMGNKEAEKSYSVIVDNTGPAVIVTANAPMKKVGEKLYFTRALFFSINAGDALSGVNKVEYSTNGIDYKEYAAPFSIPSKGEITMKVKAIDNVNNPTEQFAFRVVDDYGNVVESTDAAIKLYTDETPPVVEIRPDKEIKQIDAKNVTTTDVKYTVTARDDESGVAVIFYRVDGKGEFVPYKSMIQFLTNGKHQIDAKAVDKVGNVSDIVTFSVYVDVLPPRSTIETMTK
jgi:hypothetical protein